MDSREHIDLFVLLIQQVLEIPDFRLQRAYSFLQGFGVAARESATTQFIARFALEANVGALSATWSDAVTTDLLASASITGLGNTTLGAVADLDHFHRKNSRHFGGMLWRICLRMVSTIGRLGCAQISTTQ